jgi:hypothetical protein
MKVKRYRTMLEANSSDSLPSPSNASTHTATGAMDPDQECWK